MYDKKVSEIEAVKKTLGVSTLREVEEETFKYDLVSCQTRILG